MRSLFNRWFPLTKLSPLTHTSDCITTSRHTDEIENKPSHAPQGIFTPDALPAATLSFLDPAQNAGLHTLNPFSIIRYEIVHKVQKIKRSTELHIKTK